MSSRSDSFHAPQRAIERLGGRLAAAAGDLESRKNEVPALRACLETLAHLPPRRAPSALAHPEEPGRSLEWGAGVVEYGLFLTRLHACEEAFCNDTVPAWAPLPYEPPEEGKPLRIVVPATADLLKALKTQEEGLPPETRNDLLMAPLPAIELRAHDGAGPWAACAIARFGYRALEALWIGTAQARPVERLAGWIRDLFSAFWAWTRAKDDDGNEARAADILGLAHRITMEARHACRRDASGQPRYPVHLRSGASQFLGFNEAFVARRLGAARAALIADLGTAHGLEVIQAADAPDAALDHRIAFWDELPPPPDGVVVVRQGSDAGDAPLRRGTRYATFGEPPAHLVKVMELKASKQLRPFKASKAWFDAVRRATEAALLHQINQLPGPEGARVRTALAEAYGDLAGELWDADERQRAQQVATYCEHFFGQHLVPPLPTTAEADMRLRRGDQASLAAVDWEGSEALPGDALTRGTVLEVKRFGVRETAGVLRPAVLHLALGPPSTIGKLGHKLARLIERTPWLQLDPEAARKEGDRVAAEFLRCDADFFQDRLRERELLESWLRGLERDVGGDAQRAQEVSRHHLSLLQRAAQIGADLSPFLTATRLGNVTLDPSIIRIHYAYKEDTAPLDVLGVLHTGLWGGPRMPEILVSRGAAVPAWVAPLKAAAQAAPGTMVDLAAEFDAAQDARADFEAAGWRAHFIGRLLRAASGSTEESRGYLQAVQAALSAAPDMERFALVPEIAPSGGFASVELPEDDPETEGGLTQWFTDSAAAGEVVSIERPGLYERMVDGRGRWHVPPSVTVSAGVHTDFTRRAQPLLRSLVEWLDLAPLTEHKRERYRDLLRAGALKRFRDLGTPTAEAPDVNAAIARLLCSPRGVVAFLCQIACRDAGILGAVEQLARSASLSVEHQTGLGFAEADAGELEPAPVLVAELDRDGAAHLRRGGVERVLGSVAGVALEVIKQLGQRDDLDVEAREARAVGDTLMSLAGPESGLQSAAIFVATKVYSLLPDERGEGEETTDGSRERLHAGVQAALERMGMSVYPIRIGEDVRQYEGRYKARAGATNWRVTRVERPCLMKGNSVIQAGIVETD